MKRENQALRLAEMMLNKNEAHRGFELILPSLGLERSELKKLSQQDILLLGMDTLVFNLIKNDTIYANLVPKVIGERFYLEIINICKKPIESNDSNHYQNLLISFGKVQSINLTPGFRIDITQRPLESVAVIVEGNKYASASLVNVAGALAVKIEKVER